MSATRRSSNWSAAPRARGWTVDSSKAEERIADGPAHAGMNRNFGYMTTESQERPRARGDEPVTLRITDWSAAPRTRG